MLENKSILKHRVDAEGYHIDDVYTDEVSEFYVETRKPDGMFKARWVNNEWLDEEAYRRDEINGQLYKEYRKLHYPPVEDFLDAIVKGDEEQKQAYIDQCLAVKAAYPKGVVPEDHLEP